MIGLNLEVLELQKKVLMCVAIHKILVALVNGYPLSHIRWFMVADDSNGAL